MAVYEEIPVYVDQLVVAAIGVHMRERFPSFPIWTVRDGGWEFSEAGLRMRIQCPDGTGRFGGAASILEDAGGLTPEEAAGIVAGYDQTHAFARIRELVHEIIEGTPWTSDTVNWRALPSPTDYEGTLSLLKDAICVLSVADTNNNIKGQVESIRAVLDRTNADGSPNVGDPMSGSYVDALRKLLTGDDEDNNGQLISLCMCAHDLLVALAWFVQAEQGIWKAARDDAANVIFDAIAVFDDWRPGTNSDLGKLTAVLGLATALFALAGSMMTVPAAIFGLFAGMTAVSDAFDTGKTSMSSCVRPCSSVDGLIQGLSDSLASVIQVDGGSTSVAQGIYAREWDLFLNAQAMAVSTTTAAKSGNQPVLLRPNRVLYKSNAIPSADLDELSTVASIYLDRIIDDLEAVVGDLEKINEFPAMDDWLRPPGLGYALHDGKRGPFDMWNTFAVAILDLVGETGTWYGQAIKVLRDVQDNILTYKTTVQEADADDAGACERIRNGWS